MLDTIGKVSNNGMHMRTTRNLSHMQISLTGITVRQDKQATRSLLSDLELVASSRPPPPLIQFLVRDMLALQILPGENGACLDVLPFEFNTKSIVACRQTKKKRRPAACQWVKYPQLFSKLPGIGSCKKGYIQ